MSDQDLGKKMVEEEELRYFREAYEFVVGDTLSEGQRNERPDFICERADGLAVGIELTKLMRDPETAFWDEVLDRRTFRSGDEVFYAAQEATAKKGAMRKKGPWGHSDNTILVLQLMDCPLSEAKPFFDRSLQVEFAAQGFAEIWIADHTTIEPFGAVDLFGLHPEKWWGVP